MIARFLSLTADTSFVVANPLEEFRQLDDRVHQEGGAAREFLPDVNGPESPPHGDGHHAAGHGEGQGPLDGAKGDDVFALGIGAFDHQGSGHAHGHGEGADVIFDNPAKGFRLGKWQRLDGNSRMPLHPGAATATVFLGESARRPGQECGRAITWLHERVGLGMRQSALRGDRQAIDTINDETGRGLRDWISVVEDAGSSDGDVGLDGGEAE